MSNKKVADSRLSTWKGPIFHNSTLHLHRVYASFEGLIDSAEIEAAAVPVRQFQRRSGQEVASDNYIGFWTLVFAVNGGLVAVRLPRFDDKEREDGTATDRCIAVYTMGNVFIEEVDRVADDFRLNLAKHPALVKRNVVAEDQPAAVL